MMDTLSTDGPGCGSEGHPAGESGEVATVGLIGARRRGLPTPPIGNTGALTTGLFTGTPGVR